jgi:hypothetical protein
MFDAFDDKNSVKAENARYQFTPTECPKKATPALEAPLNHLPRLDLNFQLSCFR